jgi:predicted nucleic acid-binding protein
MKVLDTDILTLFLKGHAKVIQRRRHEDDQVVIAVVTRIEILQGRFATLLKAADGASLKEAQARLDQAEHDLRPFAVVPITDQVAAEFDRLRRIRNLRKIGRGDLLIAAIVLANRAVLVTRNTKDFALIPGLRVENWAD